MHVLILRSHCAWWHFGRALHAVRSVVREIAPVVLGYSVGAQVHDSGGMGLVCGSVLNSLARGSVCR